MVVRVYFKDGKTLDIECQLWEISDNGEGINIPTLDLITTRDDRDDHIVACFLLSEIQGVAELKGIKRPST